MVAVNNVTMRGPYTVRHGIVDYLRENLNPLLAQLRVEWDLEASQLPDFKLSNIDTYKQFVVEHSQESLIEVDVQRSRDFNQVDIDGAGAEQYQIVYNVRIYTWVKEVGREEVLR